MTDIEHIASLIDPAWPNVDAEDRHVIIEMAQRVWDAGYRRPSTLSSQPWGSEK